MDCVEGHITVLLPSEPCVKCKLQAFHCVSSQLKFEFLFLGLSMQNFSKNSPNFDKAVRHFTGVLSTATSRASPCCCCLRATFLIVSRSYCRITVLKPQKDWLHALPSQSHHHTLSKGVTESYFQLESSSDLSTESCHCRLHLNFKFSSVTPNRPPVRVHIQV